MGLTKLGGNNLTLAASNNYAGPTIVSAGTLNRGAARVHPPGQPDRQRHARPERTELHRQQHFRQWRRDQQRHGRHRHAHDRRRARQQHLRGRILNGSGAVALTKIGPGELVLSGANTYTGTTLISNGTVRLAFSFSGNVLPATSAVQMAAGALLDINGGGQIIGSLTARHAHQQQCGDGFCADHGQRQHVADLLRSAHCRAPPTSP